jgi:hypothetical protein
MVDRLGVGGTREVKSLVQLHEGRGVFGRTQVEVPAKQQRCIAGPLGRHRCRAQHVVRRHRRRVVGRVQVCDAQLRALSFGACDPSERHRPPLWRPGMYGHLPPLHDPRLPVRFWWSMTTKSAPE